MFMQLIQMYLDHEGVRFLTYKTESSLRRLFTNLYRRLIENKQVKKYCFTMADCNLRNSIGVGNLSICRNIRLVVNRILYISIY